MAAHCSAWLFSCLPCGDTLLWPLDEVDCAEPSLHPPLQSLDLEQSLLQTGTAPGREEGMYTDAPGMSHLHAPGEQELGRHSKLVFHDSRAGGDSPPPWCKRHAHDEYIGHRCLHSVAGMRHRSRSWAGRPCLSCIATGQVDTGGGA